jgi:hypothetical protein
MKEVDTKDHAEIPGGYVTTVQPVPPGGCFPPFPGEPVIISDPYVPVPDTSNTKL